MNAIYTNGSKHFDFRTKLQFDRILIGGLFIGIARNITDEQAKQLEGREGYRLLTDEQLIEEQKRPQVPEVPSTGDPIADSAPDLEKLSYQEQRALAKSRGIKFEGSPTKDELLAALRETPVDPLGGAPEPPVSG